MIAESTGTRRKWRDRQLVIILLSYLITGYDSYFWPNSAPASTYHHLMSEAESEDKKPSDVKCSREDLFSVRQ